MRRLVVAAAALAALVLGVTPASPSAPDGSFVVGFTEDLPKSIGAAATAPMRDLGAGAFRITTMWSPGQVALTADDVTRVGRAVSGSSGLRVVLAVYADAGSKAPRDATARDQYCATVRDALVRFPSIRDVVIWNEPNKSLFWNPQTTADGSAIAPADYAALLARCWDVLHAARADVNVVGLALSSNGNDNAGSTSPGNFIRLVGDAYRASGRTKPLFDTVGYHPYGSATAERPWRKHIASKVIAMGDWNKLMYNLHLAFTGTAQRIPGQAGMSIWYLEVGFQTAVDAGKEGSYTGAENTATLPDFAGGEADAPAPAETTNAPDQATQVLDAIRLAACQPSVGAVFNFLLADEPRLEGWQSGALWADRTPKDSYAAFASAIAQVNARSVDCSALKGGPPSADYLPPPVPGAVAAEPLTNPLRVTVSWSGVVDDASAVSYRIYRNGAHVGTTTATSWTNVAVASGQTYTYNVRAIDAAGNLGDASASVTVTTPDTVAPTPPTALVATPAANPGRVDLAWAPSGDDVGVAGYDVLRDGVKIGTASGTAFTDATVAGRTTYAYAVVAFDAAGNRSSAASATVTTGDLAPPTAPGSLTATGNRTPLSIRVAWSPASDDTGVTAYEVRRDGVLVATVGGGEYVDTAVVDGGRYVYGVRARDAAGNAGPEATVAASAPDATAPSVPTGVSARSLSSPLRVAVSWSPSSDNVGVAGYRVLRDGVVRATVTTTTWTDASVTSKTSYRYQVVAFDAAGNASAASAEVTLKTGNR